LPWALVGAVAPELVSFDVVRHGLNSEAQAALNDLLTGGTRVAWGVLDPVDPAGTEVVAALASASISALAVGRSPEEVAARSLLTPSCGTGRLSATREQLIAAILQAAAMATTGRGLRNKVIRRHARDCQGDSRDLEQQAGAAD
jgi:hypothetical protein